MLAWKYIHLENFESTGKRRSKFTEEEKNFYIKNQKKKLFE